MARGNGFTLIEVLVALVIFAVGVMATLRAMGVVITGSSEQRLRLAAGWVAENRLAEMRATGRFPPLGTNEGEETMAGQHYVWREETKATPNPLFRRVDVSVFLTEGDDHALSRLSGFAVKPLR
ncbi:MAG: type II secretion system minor pseudopilin GspI [Gammaproteobacteria bacterium]|nr:type II secretion system minor pseudopilin GspI [Gammaproteobacteria bacterium]MBU1414873.1 type II secretion system minor pseudopilin GspI [Gammaproteobacteria bacterium]